jgi:hypothetical protein
MLGFFLFSCIKVEGQRQFRSEYDKARGGANRRRNGNYVEDSARQTTKADEAYQLPRLLKRSHLFKKMGSNV